MGAPREAQGHVRLRCRRKETLAGTSQGQATACGPGVVRTQVVVRGSHGTRGVPELEKYLGGQETHKQRLGSSILGMWSS